MNLKVTLYLDVVSSWCYWAAHAWLDLREQFDGAPVEFDWKIALIDAAGMSKTRAQAEWFYRRSGTVVQAPYMLNAAWLEPGVKQYPAPNCVAEAAKDFGVTTDLVWIAIAESGLHWGKKVGQWEVAAAVAAKAAKLNAKKLLAHAKSEEVRKRVEASTAEFHSFKISQRPAFVLESNLGDRAVFSGCWRLSPLVATIESMLADAKAYDSYEAHFGKPPSA
jgi:predicted DsbA family dithiol-disulfide isomerase